MRKIRVENETRGTALGDSIQVAENLVTRVVGLLRHTTLAPGEGLWIVPCNSIHSFWMKFRFDAIFVDKNHVVVGIISDMARGRISRVYSKAHGVLELPSGTAAATKTQIGDQLKFL